MAEKLMDVDLKTWLLWIFECEIKLRVGDNGNVEL